MSTGENKAFFTDLLDLGAKHLATADQADSDKSNQCQAQGAKIFLIMIR
jgi:hypothetical protein